MDGCSRSKRIEEIVFFEQQQERQKQQAGGEIPMRDPLVRALTLQFRKKPERIFLGEKHEMRRKGLFLEETTDQSERRNGEDENNDVGLVEGGKWQSLLDYLVSRSNQDTEEKDSIFVFIQQLPIFKAWRGDNSKACASSQSRLKLHHLDAFGHIFPRGMHIEFQKGRQLGIWQAVLDLLRMRPNPGPEVLRC